MKTAGDILAADDREVWSISSTATVFEALKLMSDKNIGALPVRDKERNVVGIFSERDYARKVALLGRTAHETAVEAVMTPDSQMITILPETSLETCMALMTMYQIRHLPVFARERLVGIISSRDVVRALIQEKYRVINSLRDVSTTLFTQDYDDYFAGGKG
ncbi:MAG: CBS domain-containing protein [Candidatus Aminicenantes bacterium]|nr:CBS domain-containing protein [Candidatus Aminicenantes bacterium]